MSKSDSKKSKKSKKTKEYREKKLARKEEKKKRKEEKKREKLVRKQLAEQKKKSPSESKCDDDKKLPKPIEEKVEDCGPPVCLMSRGSRPETKAEYDKRQTFIRRVEDPETGRTRLIRGDGEVLEEMVTKNQHKKINKQATDGDGRFFQQSTLGSTYADH